MKYYFKENVAEIINYTFQVVLVTYLVLILTEQLFSGTVSAYINLNYALIIVIILGVLDIFCEHKTTVNKRATKKDYLFIFALGIVGFIIIKTKTISLGWLSWLIAGIAGILIILLSILVLEDEDNETE